MKDTPVLITFPYRENPPGEYFPIIPLSLIHQDTTIGVSALIDSGATISVFRPEVANKLGLKLETGKEIFMSGVGGRIKGYLHEIDMKTAGRRFGCPIVFSNEINVSYNLLGRNAFFENFYILFKEKRHEVELA